MAFMVCIDQRIKIPLHCGAVGMYRILNRPTRARIENKMKLPASVEHTSRDYCNTCSLLVYSLGRR